MKMVCNFDKRQFVDDEGMDAMRAYICMDDTTEWEGKVMLDAGIEFSDYRGTVAIDFSTFGDADRLEEVREKLLRFSEFVEEFTDTLYKVIDNYETL